MKCNYDGWTTKVVNSVTPKMINVLQVMKDGVERCRADMLRAADIEPNPKSDNGYPGNERTDFYLYRKGLISVVRIDGSQKIFKITDAGRKAV